MLALDMRTIIVANIIINAVYIIVIVQLWYQNRSKYAGLDYWIVGWALQFGGTLLIALRGTVPNWASIVLSNSMLAGGTLLLYFGLRRFAGKKNAPSINYAILVIFAVFVFVHSYFTFVHDDLLARSFNVSSGLALACFLGMWLMLRGVSPEIRRISRGTGISFAIIILISLARIMGFTLLPYTSNDYMQSGLFDTLMVALLAGAVMLLVFNLVLMVNRRLYLESKQIEDALRETSDYLDNLLDYANAPIIVWDPQFRITRFNHAFERITGRLADEVIGKELDILLPAASHDVSMNYIRNTISGEHWEAVEIPIMHKDGSVRTVLWNSASLYSADGKNMLATIAQGQDITERKKSEAALIASEAKFRNLVGNAAAGILITLPDGHILSANKAALEILGFGSEEEITKTLSSERYTDIEDRKRLLEYLKEKGFAKGIEMLWKHKDGTLFWVSLNIIPQITESGETQFISIIEDITKRKQIEETLRDSESKYKELAESISDIFFAMDNELRYTYWNKASEKLSGISAKEAIGKHFFDIYPETDVTRRLQDVYLNAIRTQQPQYFTTNSPGAENIIHEISVYPTKDGIVAFVKDITKRIEMEKQLLGSEKRYHDLVENANVLIQSVGPDAHFIYVNKAWREVLGYSEEEISELTIWDIIHPNHVPGCQAIFRRVMAGEIAENVEVIFVTKSGKFVTVEGNINSLSEGGKVLATRAIFRDITERKQLEQRLQQAAEQWQKTFDSITNLVSIQDNNCRLVMVNKAYADTFKKTPQELIGKLCFELVHRTTKSIPNCPHQQTMLTGKPAKAEFFEPNLGLYVEVNTSPIFDAEGKVTGSVHIVQNISERKQAEEKTKQDQAELSIINTKLEARNHQNSLLSEMRELLQACSTIQEIPPIVTNSATEVFPGTDGALFLLNNSRTDLQSVARWGDFPEDIDDNVFAPDACWGLRRGRIYLIEDMKTGPICPHLKHPPTSAYICLPLIAKGETLGLLHLRIKPSVLGEDRHNIISELKEIAVIFAEYLSLSIANIKLWEKLAYQSIRDPLTGLYNRRYMEETMQREILRAARKQTNIGIVMADIDHFKFFNDTHGHKAGDELLVKLADLFKLKIRGSDIACRYGGEEFILILPESSAEDTYKRAESIRKEVKNMKAYYRDQLLPPITISMGITTYPDHGIDANELIRLADIALYKAKEQGRDRVISN